MRYRPKRENYAIGQFGEIDYQERLERYCTYLENKNKQLHILEVVKCKCKIPKPLQKCSENGISSYCGKCAKSL